MMASFKRRLHFVTRGLAVSSLPLALLCSVFLAGSQEKAGSTPESGAPTLRLNPSALRMPWPAWWQMGAPRVLPCWCGKKMAAKRFPGRPGGR